FANILVFVGLVSVCWGQSTCKVPVACNDGQGGTTYEWRGFGSAPPGVTQGTNQPTQAPTNAPTIQSDTQSTDQNVQRLTNIITRLQEPGWISGLNGYQYYVASRGTNVGVADAQLLCQAKGGALATVGMRDPASRTHIVDNILRRCTDMHGFWIGLRKNDSGNWVYDDGVESNALNTDWANNQPDGYNNAACTAVARYQNYKWDDVPCNANNGVLCERFAGLV
uniref:C-type lectin domain-containing protein n=1 Tax=Ciona savignyi TaxID=51511 RepID=H2Y892_CIOSA